MFKIRKIEIAGIGPFPKESPRTVHFGPFFTLLRGKSGSGKTTVLESLALLGHANVMRPDVTGPDNPAPDPKWDRWAGYTVVVGKCPFSDDRLKKLSEQWNAVLDGKETAEIKVWIHLPHDIDNKEEALQTILTTESLLERCFIAGTSAHVHFLQDLVAFSRPKQKLSVEKARERKVQGYLNQSFSEAPKNIAKEICEEIKKAKPEFEAAPRSAWLDQAGVALPPLVAYFNTDSHEGGVGLDIRESPKRLSDDLVDLLVRRLQVVNGEGRVANEKAVRNFWAEVQTDSATARRSSSLIINITGGKDARIGIVDRTIDEIIMEPNSAQAKKIIREFVSSGENQVLFLAILLEALRPANSLLMLDEPDLHMSLPVAMKMFNKVYEKAIRDDMQVIAASHLSFVFPNALHRQGVLQDLDSYLDLYQASREEFARGMKVTKCVTLHWLNKLDDGSTEIRSQEEAANRAGKFQNFELDSILRQSQLPTQQAAAKGGAAKTPASQKKAVLGLQIFKWGRKAAPKEAEAKEA